jgi:hypothetical protein
MPYYRITIHLKGEYKPHVGVRESTIKTVDAAWLYYRGQAERAYNGRIKRFEVVMLSRHSADVADFLSRARRPPTDGL